MSGFCYLAEKFLEMQSNNFFRTWKLFCFKEWVLAKFRQQKIPKSKLMFLFVCVLRTQKLSSPEGSWEVALELYQSQPINGACIVQVKRLNCISFDRWQKNNFL